VVYDGDEGQLRASVSDGTSENKIILSLFKQNCNLAKIIKIKK
jgi:hypothetical protein